MDFDFSDDQESLRDAVRKWVDKGYDFDRRRKAVKAGGFDRSAYANAHRHGYAAAHAAAGYAAAGDAIVN